jgi:3-oxoacyl-[acyl-carrier protein] reductase
VARAKAQIGYGLEFTLSKKVVLVTGASRGIGRAIAVACAAAGADVVLTYRTSQRETEEVAGAVRALGRRAQAQRADTALPEDVDQLARAARAAFGRVDAWINNAGADILTESTAQRPRLEKLDLLLAVDLRGTILASWAAVELMRAQAGGGGTIINMSWDHVATGFKGEPAELFAAAKGGVASFSKSLARSVAPEIRVNVLAPGWIETAYGVGLDADVKARIAKSVPLERWGTPNDVAHAAVYLASDAAAYITGQMLMINGGAVV